VVAAAPPAPTPPPVVEEVTTSLPAATIRHDPPATAKIPTLEEGLPATIQAKAAPERPMPTVRMASTPAATPLEPAVRVAPGPPVTPAAVAAAAADTTKISMLEPTVAARVPTTPQPSPASTRSPVPVTVTAPTPVPSPTVTARAPAAPMKGVSTGLVLGGAAALFVVAVIVAASVFFRGREAAPSPSPVAEITTPPTLETPPPPPAVDGVLQVDTQPTGATIKVNGEAKGVAPVELGLPIGNYDVRAELKGYEPKTETVTITADALRSEVRLTLSRIAPTTGSAEIVSTPPGATLMVDGSRSGDTPVADLKLKAGSHRLELSKEGFEPWQGSVTVEAGKKSRVDVTLQLVPTPPPPPKVEALDPEHVYLNTVSEVETLAKKVAGPLVTYPKNAPRPKSGESISVSGTFVVNEKGEVEDVKVLESAGRQVDDAVTAAIRQWKYQPAAKQGQKVKVKISFKQTFMGG
jgi:TonB family protein